MPLEARHGANVWSGSTWQGLHLDGAAPSPQRKQGNELPLLAPRSLGEAEHARPAGPTHELPKAHVDERAMVVSLGAPVARSRTAPPPTPPNEMAAAITAHPRANGHEVEAGAHAMPRERGAAINRHVPGLAGKTIGAANQRAIDHELGTDTGAESDHDQISTAPPGTELCFGQCCGGQIVLRLPLIFA